MNTANVTPISGAVSVPSATMTTKLRVDTLIVDPEVQRTLNPTKVNRMCRRGLSRDGLGVIVVSLRDDGRYHIVDGQHRQAFLLKVGLGSEMVDCLVHTGLSRADEARMFLLLNDRTAITALDKFRIAVVQGDSSAVDINNILLRHGWEVRSSRGRGRVQAVKALETVHKRAKADGHVITEILVEIVTNAWALHKDSMREEIVGGLGVMLLRYREAIDVDKLTRALAQFPGGPLGLVGRAKALRELRGGLKDTTMAEIMVEQHDKGRRSGRRLSEISK